MGARARSTQRTEDGGTTRPASNEAAAFLCRRALLSTQRNGGGKKREEAEQENATRNERIDVSTLGRRKQTRPLRRTCTTTPPVRFRRPLLATLSLSSLLPPSHTQTLDWWTPCWLAPSSFLSIQLSALPLSFSFPFSLSLSLSSEQASERYLC